jgi:hypothetical protein
MTGDLPAHLPCSTNDNLHKRNPYAPHQKQPLASMNARRAKQRQSVSPTAFKF